MSAYHEAEQLDLSLGLKTSLPFTDMKATNIRDIEGFDPAHPTDCLPSYVFKQTGRPFTDYFVQEKFNGVGFRARARTGCIELWTTRGKYWPTSFFPQMIYNGLNQILLTLPPESVLFGEFVSAQDNIKLATLAGQCSVNSPKFTGDEALLRARVYDYWPGNGKLFQYRIRDLRQFQDWKHPNVRSVYTLQTDRCALIEQMFRDIVADSGEGVVIRFDPCVLGLESSGRHPMIVKWKQLHEAEGLCIRAYEGSGKRTGMLGGFVLRATINGVETEFSVGGGTGLTDELLTKLWIHPPLGKQVTFTYEELSINGTPLRPQFVAVRDYEH